MNSRDYALSALKFVRGMSNDMLKGYPEDRMTHQNSPSDNHPVWVMGHLAMTDGWALSLLGGTAPAIPDTYKEIFGPGTKPTSDSKAYPPAPDVRRVFDDVRTALIRWYETAPDAALTVALSDKSGGFFNDPIDALIKLGWHEGWHFGQVATIRKSLGLPNVMG